MNQGTAVGVRVCIPACGVITGEVSPGSSGILASVSTTEICDRIWLMRARQIPWHGSDRRRIGKTVQQQTFWQGQPHPQRRWLTLTCWPDLSPAVGYFACCQPRLRATVLQSSNKPPVGRRTDLGAAFNWLLVSRVHHLFSIVQNTGETGRGE